VWPKISEAGGDKVMLDLKNFLACSQPVEAELVRRSLVHLGSGESDLTQQHYERVLQAAQEETSGRIIELPGGFLVRREYEKLVFARRRETDTAMNYADETVKLQVPGQTQFSNFLIEATILEADKEIFKKFKREKTNFIEWFDLDKVNLPLSVRFRRAGDKFWPLGLAGEKRVGKFLTAVKIPLEIRKKAVIVADAERIVWVWPVRISERAKVTDETRKILQLRIIDTKIAY
jgi:tRNA(Ile)-lysidine synthase